MHLYSITLRQKHVKYQLSQYFYSQILNLPKPDETSATTTRWYHRPMHLVVEDTDPVADDQPRGGFTGIQLNLVPARELNTLMKALRQTGTKLAPARQVGEAWLITIYDPTLHALVIYASDAVPDEPTLENGIGSVAVFVTDLNRAKSFYVNTLGLPVRAQPDDGLIVLGEQPGTALMLYKTTRTNPNTPIGRDTGIAFYGSDMNETMAAITRTGGMILSQTAHPEQAGELMSFTFRDPEKNTYTLLNEAYLSIPEPEPVVVHADQPDNELGLELDAEPAVPLDEIDTGYTFDRDLELD